MRCKNAVSEHGKCGRRGSEDGMWMGCVNSVPITLLTPGPRRPGGGKTSQGNESRVTISGCLSADRKNSSLAHLHRINGEACLLGLAPHKLITRVTLGLCLRVYLFFLRVYLEIEIKLLFYYHYLGSVLMLTVSKIPKILVQENI